MTQHLVFDEDGETLGFISKGRRGWLAIPRTIDTAISLENSRQPGEMSVKTYQTRALAEEAVRQFETEMARDPALGLILGAHYATRVDRSQTHLWDENRWYLRTVHH